MPTADDAKQQADAAKEHTRDVAQHAGDQARQITDTARQQAGEVARQATDRGRDVLRDAGQELRTHADSQAERASGALHDLSRQLRAMADGAGRSGGVVDLARDTAERTETFARRLDQGGAQGMLDDLSDFARRRPGVFLLGAGVAGLAVGRLLRNADLGQVKEAASSGSDPGTTDTRQLSAASREVSPGTAGVGGPTTTAPPR